MERAVDLEFDRSFPTAGDEPSGVPVRELAQRVLGEPPKAATTRDAEPETSPEAGEPNSIQGLFNDIPRSIWTTFLAGWAGFFLLMWFFFAVNAGSTFMLTVVMLFGMMAFGLPILMGRQSMKSGGAARSDSAMVQTNTGPVTIRAAGAQIALIPIAVDIGLIAFILLAKL